MSGRVRACLASAITQYEVRQASWPTAVSKAGGIPKPAEAKNSFASVNPSAAIPPTHSEVPRADRPLGATTRPVFAKGPTVLLFHGPDAGELKMEFPRPG